MLFPYNGEAKIYAECGGGNLANNKRVFVSSLYTLWQRAVLKTFKICAPNTHTPPLRQFGRLCFEEARRS